MKTLAEIDATDLARVGGKAYNCARLLRAGFPVPDGLAIPYDATEPELRWLPDDAWFDTVPPDALFAVRSSGLGEDGATSSFAGIHETQLNVPRQEVLEAVLVCRRSAQSPQASAYRRARRLGDLDASIGVLVQRMVPAVTSGVAFTTNPVTGADEIVIEAAWGLGEALVSGRVEPDEYVVRKTDLRTIAVRRAEENGKTQPALTDRQLAELAALVRDIEDFYGTPQDIEWCHDGTQFWVVQSRPVTTTSRISEPTKNAEDAKDAKDNRYTAGAGVDIEWTRANLAEVLPDQLTPQALHGLEDMLNRAERKWIGRLMAPESELGPIMKSFNGRIYVNLTQLRHVIRMTGAAPADLLRSLGHPEQITAEDERKSKPDIVALLRRLPDVVRIGLSDARVGALVRRHEVRVREALTKFAAIDPHRLSDAEMWSTYQWWDAETPDVLQVVFALTNVTVRERTLRDICKAVGFPYERLVYTHLAAGEKSVSTQQAIDLVRLAETARHEPRAVAYLSRADAGFDDLREALAGTTFLARFDQFLARYGHRGRYESDWGLPRLREDPAPVLFAVREQLRGQPTDLRALAERQEADAAAAMRAFEARLTPWQRWTRLPIVKSILRRLKKQYVWREQVRSDLTRVLAVVREWHLVLANRFVERGWLERRDDYFLILLPEVGAVIADPTRGPGLRAIAARRAAELEAQRPIEMPLLMHESELPSILARRPAGPPAVRRDDHARAAAGMELNGLCVSAGVVEADVVVMRDPKEFAAMRRGAILVAPATDPSWTPLFTLASGVIVEVGGMLSHASTIAREYGLPALANVKNATRILKTGDRVRLDASGGRVIVL